MSNFKIDIAVTIGATAELTQLLTALLSVVNLKTSASNLKTSAINVETSVGNVETSAANVATPVEVAEEPTPIVEVDEVRKAMERTRKRLMGEDYKTSDMYPVWKEKLKDFFISSARLFGSDRPSELPDYTSRQAFIKLCDEVVINGDELTVNPSF